MDTALETRLHEEDASPVHTNRLAGEMSPYLEQHAHNPVDWFPWTEEAFARAAREDKPVFLSIGYSTCHWCHVMERESFEDEQVAALLNEGFVSIKVDREERPDIDHIYMTACQLMTGSGGWPLTIVMTPDLKPFFAGTYIPRESRYGRTGMMELLPRIREAWESKRERLVDSADSITELVADATRTVATREPGEDALRAAFEELELRFDDENAGFGRGMKFPTPHQLVFLLRYWRRTGDEAALRMAEGTLTAMRRGGIFDHVGFGFHRYSTDPEWLVPHFEKMLYDQALAMLAYGEAYEATRKPDYARVVREIALYVERDLTSPEGAFYSAEDADSQGEEGRFYVWTTAELRRLLGEEEAAHVGAHFGVTLAGNFEEEGTGRRTGRNILNLGGFSSTGVEEPVGVTDQRIETARLALLEARGRRVRPARDEKVLVDWNGLMIGALARASRVLDDQALGRSARRAADFVLSRMVTAEGELLHRYRGGSAGIPAMLEDYAFLVFGLLELYEATFETAYLARAMELNRRMIERFRDEAGGGFFIGAADGERLIVRAKELYDGALPSGNSVAYANLTRLARMTGDPELEELAAGTARAYGRALGSGASSHAFFLTGLDFALGPSLELVIAGRRGSEDGDAMLAAAKKIYAPNKVVLFRDEERAAELARLVPFVAGQVMRDGRATAYVCVERACSFPTDDPEKMVDLIRTRATTTAAARGEALEQ